MPISIAEIRRYPVKGLTAESLDSVTLARGEGLPHDRRFAIAHGSARIDADAPRWMPRDNFLMLAKNEKLAQLEAHFDPEAGTLTLRRGFGHTDLGVFLEVAAGGAIAPGATIEAPD